MKSSIRNIKAREILDSRGNPTIEVTMTLKNGVRSKASVPSGASTGEYEAMELRDNDLKRFLGKGVLQAVENVNTKINYTLQGKDVLDLKNIDYSMIKLDGTKNKSNLGANSILGVSLAAAHAGAKFLKKPLYEYLNSKNEFLLPAPMMNILNGGSHADNNIDIQEFMVFPFGADSFSEALRMGTEVFHNLKSVLKGNQLNTSVGDEGGFAPNLSSNEEALELIIKAIEIAGYHPGRDIYIALDVAASELFKEGKYHFKSDNKSLTSNQVVEYYQSLIDKYPIISIEDGLDENDWVGWQSMNEKIGSKVQIVGDDLTVTNKERLQRAIDQKCINSILIKPNQIGTLSETLEAIDLAKKNGISSIISHRSGETEDTTIADLAVAVNSGQIKTGSSSRTDRICKYNQLLKIEQELGAASNFPTLKVIGKSS